jgi:hypothetical protein
MIEKNRENMVNNASNLEIAIMLISCGFVEHKVKNQREKIRISKNGLIAVDLLNKLVKGGNI